MITQELIQFIKEQLAKGKTKDDVHQILSLQGWQDQEIEQGFNMAMGNTNNVPVPQSGNKELSRLASIGQLLSGTFKLYKGNFWRFWLISLIYGAIIFFLLFLINFLIPLFGNNFIFGIILSGIGGIIASLLIVSASLSLIFVSAQADTAMSIKEIILNGIKKTFGFLGLNIVDSLATMGALIISIVLLCIGFFGLFSVNISLPVILILAIIFAIPGIILSIYLAFDQYIFALEKKKIMDSLSTSIARVKGSFWAILWRIIVMGVIVGALEIIVELILSSIPNEDIGRMISGTIGLLIFTPITLNFIYLLYKSTKHVKQNASIVSYKKIFIILSIIGIIGFSVMIYSGIHMLMNILNMVESQPETKSFWENNAPNNAADARIKASIAQVRDVADMISIETNSYATVCNGSTLGVSPELSAIASSIAQNSGITYCASSANAYCVTSSLNDGKFCCVDSTGVFKIYDDFPACSPLSLYSYTCDLNP